MIVFRCLVFITTAVIGMASGTMNATNPALGGDAAEKKVHVRVLYLQGLDPHEAVTLLRSQAQVRQLAWIRGRDVIVVAGEEQRVGRCETLLRERDAILRVAVPHEPVNFALPEGDPLTTRVFRVAGDNLQAVVVVLRSIYQVRELEELAQDNTVKIQSTQRIVESSESLLRELNLLEPPVKVSRGW